jgi:ribosome biogenesis protein BMS1
MGRPSSTTGIVITIHSLSQERRRQQRDKKLEKEDQWRAQYNKEERKKRYIEAGQAEKRKEMAGKYSKKARRN